MFKMSQTSAKEKTSNDGICISQVKIPVSVPYKFTVLAYLMFVFMLHFPLRQKQTTVEAAEFASQCRA
jgi:hypothetical protein